eukprot:TRINITY_DN45888_c0_g1_i1.p1 TRINITY_DN45888_c0_g1~~TRINITY_DN45888_c0_g1_i1.p1  ORF type:complete len:285 (-),score=53.92 TRINITY_DN45888_c0_g1_i1:106-960(-)
MTSVFVRGFEFDTDEESLKSHFAKAGSITDLYFQSKGSAVITYESADVAKKVVEEMDGSTIKGQQRYVSVKLDDPDREVKGKGDGKGKGKSKWKAKGSEGSSDGVAVYANGFEYDTDEDTLMKHFSKVGKISGLHFQSKGSAVIVYEDAEAADKAVAEIDGSTIKGQQRYVAVKLDDPDRARKSKGGSKGASTESGKSVYASGFEFSTDEAILKKHFSKVGKIQDVYFQSKGSAVVTYVDESAAQRAVDELDGSTIDGQERYIAIHFDVRSSGKGKGKGKNKGK